MVVVRVAAAEAARLEEQRQADALKLEQEEQELARRDLKNQSKDDR